MKNIGKQCYGCKYYQNMMMTKEEVLEAAKRKTSYSAGCAAFPEGIPDDIMDDIIIHDKVLPEQRGNYVFTPR